MRSDALGFFWRDLPPIKKVKEVVKREPPEPVWLYPTYLPNLREALEFPVHVMDDTELVEAMGRGERLVFDVESYSNYFLIAFQSTSTGHVIYFETYEGKPLDVDRLLWVLTHFTIIGFNSINYDVPITSLALAGHSPKTMHMATADIIHRGMRPYEVLREYGAKSISKIVDHIDLREVAPLFGGLKVYGARLHTQRLQDLPFPEERILSPEQMAIVRWYCVNDLRQTSTLAASLKDQMELRETLNKKYDIEVRSKSDAQIAEAVIANEIHRRTGQRPTVPYIEPGTKFKYRVPRFMTFESELMNWALNQVATADFIVDEQGRVGLPESLKEMKLQIGNNAFQMGIGGLHSTETRSAHVSDADNQIYDFDVTSYYPAIIMQLGLYPEHLGPAFLDIYSDIVRRRIGAKKAGNVLDAESLKITVNGTFGKFGSKHSIFYSPNLVTQITLTGQLSLLMLIERYTLAGMTVVSANTDGVTVKVPNHLDPQLREINNWWERQTKFELEETRYRAYYGKDVNNYIAVKDEGKGIKSKGTYTNPWGHMDNDKNKIVRLHKNPVNTICLDAVENLLTNGVPIEDTINSSFDITKFITVRTVKGGAVKDGEFLGKTVRWYYTSNEGEIVYAKTGNKVPRSDFARPLQQLPDEFPGDLDRDWYIREANKILVNIGYAEPDSA